MSKEHPTRDELIGALLWLRNHYDAHPLRDLKPDEAKNKERVLDIIDHTLNDADLSVSHAAFFRMYWKSKTELGGSDVDV
jgi:hypothetical protein